MHPSEYAAIGEEEYTTEGTLKRGNAETSPPNWCPMLGGLNVPCGCSYSVNFLFGEPWQYERALVYVRRVVPQSHGVQIRLCRSPRRLAEGRGRVLGAQAESNLPAAAPHRRANPSNQTNNFRGKRKLATVGKRNGTYPNIETTRSGTEADGISITAPRTHLG